MQKTPGRWIRIFRRHRRAIIGFVTTLVVTFLVATLDILGLHANLQAASDTIATRMLAATDRVDAGQKAISVVLIDPAYMQGANGRAPNWPLPTNDFIGNILDPIVAAGAKAVFIDISFTDMPRAMSIGGPTQPDAVAQLGSRIREESRNTPIFVANQLPVSADQTDCAPGWVDSDGLASSGTTSQAFIAALTKADAAAGKSPARVQVVPANWLGPSTEYPVGAMIASPPHSCAAVGDAMRERGAPAAGGYLLSPAAALLNSACPGMPDTAQSLCDQFKLLRKPDANQGYALYALPSDIAPHMVVRWKTGLSPAMQARIARGQDADKCRAQTSPNKLSGMAAQVFHAFLPSIATAFSGANDDFPCFAIDTMSAAEARASGLEDPSSPEYREFTALIKDRIVLIGAALPSVPDKITTSFGVDVPGVFLHAMALDNMIAFGSAYPRRVEGGARLLRDFLEALAVALCGLALPVLVRFLKDRGWFAARSQLSRIAHFLVALLALSLGIFIMAIGLLFLFPFVGSPIFIALGVILVLTEDLRRVYFSHAETASAGGYPQGSPSLQAEGRGQPAHIFISYSSQDKKSAMALCHGLEERGLSCWIAGRDIRPGDNYQDTIVDALSSASAVVLVFSANANASAEIKKEIALAGQRKLVVVPVRIDASAPSQGFSYELATRQWIDACGDWDAALDQAADRLRHLATLI